MSLILDVFPRWNQEDFLVDSMCSKRKRKALRIKERTPRFSCFFVS